MIHINDTNDHINNGNHCVCDSNYNNQKQLYVKS